MVSISELKKTPTSCGIYMFWQGNKQIYIGKAINIRARLLSHLKNSELDSKELAIIQHSDRVTYLETDSEFNALILEAQMIQKYHPKYNVVWTDDKSYLYIKITSKDNYPKVLLTRKENDHKSLYFGPFASTRLARRLIYEVRHIVPFCTQPSITKRPCFDSKIGLCNPCPNHLAQIKESFPLLYQAEYKKYRTNIRKAINILKGKAKDVVIGMEKDLKIKSKLLQYEEAMVIRNKIIYLSNLIQNRSFKDFNVEHLVSYSSEQQLVDMNAFMSVHFGSEPAQSIGRIECYDVSNLFGTNATASMVVFTEGKPEKKSYRKFKIKTVAGISDFDMMNEVLSRRLKHKEWDFPRLIVMDGGKPQVRVGLKVKQKLDINIPLIGMAKHPDRIIIGNSTLPTIYFDNSSAFFKMIQHLRDESHRFAKKYHVLLRSKKMI